LCVSLDVEDNTQNGRKWKCKQWKKRINGIVSRYREEISRDGDFLWIFKFYIKSDGLKINLMD
jgi:hypothetical protein